MDVKFKDASPELKRIIIKTIAKMVEEGKVEYTMVDGEPAIRKITKED